MFKFFDMDLIIFFFPLLSNYAAPIPIFIFL
jgi:hypothetical protein